MDSDACVVQLHAAAAACLERRGPAEGSAERRKALVCFKCAALKTQLAPTKEPGARPAMCKRPEPPRAGAETFQKPPGWSENGSPNVEKSEEDAKAASESSRLGVQELGTTQEKRFTCVGRPASGGWKTAPKKV
uniref:Uncharacterized protein n=1 Tax=Knipowitschia caucasica TaxID=637954 RepID=A0AAV2MDF4_KNICA